MISIVVLTFNNRALLDTCLSSLLAQDYTPLEILLVDNASTDGTVDYVAQKFPTVRVISNSANLGFAEGNNVGIRAAKGDFIFIVNPDTETAPGALRELVQPMLDDAQIGSTAPKLLEFNRRDMIDAAGITVDRAGIAWHLKHGHRDDGETKPRFVFGGSGAAVMYRKSMLDRIGLFDADYFAYYEDVDLAWRAQNAGSKCLYVPRAVVYHIHGASFKNFSAWRLFLLGRNKWWTIIKNYPMPQIALFLPWIIAVDFVAVLYALLVRWEWSSLKGRIAALRGGYKMARKRAPNESQNFQGYTQHTRNRL